MCEWYSNLFPKCAYANLHFDTLWACTGDASNLFTTYVHAIPISDTSRIGWVLLKWFSWYVQTLSSFYYTSHMEQGYAKRFQYSVIKQLFGQLNSLELQLQLCQWYHTDSDILSVIASNRLRKCHEILLWCHNDSCAHMKISSQNYTCLPSLL